MSAPIAATTARRARRHFFREGLRERLAWGLFERGFVDLFAEVFPGSLQVALGRRLPRGLPDPSELLGQPGALLTFDNPRPRGFLFRRRVLAGEVSSQPAPVGFREQFHLRSEALGSVEAVEEGVGNAFGAWLPTFGAFLSRAGIERHLGLERAFTHVSPLGAPAPLPPYC